MKQIKLMLERYKDILSQKKSDYSQKTSLQYELKEEIDKLKGDISSYESLVDKYEKLLANEKYDDIIGKYFIQNSYRDDTKCGTIQIGKITEFNTQTYLRYIGVTMYYNNADYNKDIDNVRIRSVHYVVPDGERDSIYLEGFESGTFKIIDESEYIEHAVRIRQIINNNNELAFV